jgi:VirB8 protein
VAGALRELPKHEDESIPVLIQKLWYGMLAGWSVAGVLAVAICMLVRQPAPPPYAFVANIKGEPIAKLQPIISIGAIPDQVIEWELSEYITAAFAVSPIWDEEQERLAKLRAMTAGQAGHALAAWYKAGNDPLKVSATAWQDVHNVRVLKGPATNEFEATWSTERHPLNDSSATTIHWKASIGTATVKRSVNNTLGIGVQYFDFSQEESQ